MEAAYQNHLALIKKLSWRFSKRYQVDYEEVFAEANFGFLRAYTSWAWVEGNLAAWIGYGIWHHLLDWLKTLIWETDNRRHLPPVKEIEREAFHLRLFLEDLSEEGKTMVKLVFDLPKDIAGRAIEKGGKKRNIILAIRNHLREQGWAYKQIKNTFREVREALG